MPFHGMKTKLALLTTMSAWRNRALHSVHAVNENGAKKFFVEVDIAKAYWYRLREIFVAAFHRYPLYEHIVSDANKRHEFLRRYLDSIFYVSHSDKKSVIVLFRNSSPSLSLTESIVGGSLLLRPCFEGGSWKDISDEETEEAYKRFRLEEIDTKALARLKRYEEWESEHITNKLQNLSVPTWNAVFYGIEPRLIGRGNGSNGFVDGVPLLYRLQKEFEESECFCERQYIDGNQCGSADSTSYGKEYTRINTTTPSSSNTFLILGISHCPRAVQFHRKNGMLQIAALPYFTRSGNSPFDVQVLYYDPYETGKPLDIQKMFSTTHVS